MIQIGIATFLVWALFKLLDKEGYIDGFTSFAFILVPAAIVWIVSIAVVSMEWDSWIVYISEASYFLVPLLLLKAMTEYKWSRIVGYSAAVFAVNVITQGLFYVMLAPPSA